MIHLPNKRWEMLFLNFVTSGWESLLMRNNSALIKLRTNSFLKLQDPIFKLVWISIWKELVIQFNLLTLIRNRLTMMTKKTFFTLTYSTLINKSTMRSPCSRKTRIIKLRKSKPTLIKLKEFVSQLLSKLGRTLLSNSRFHLRKL